MCTGYIIKMAGTALTGFFFILFGFSKLYFAKASYDQIIFSYILGSFLAVGLHFCLKIHFVKLSVYLKSEIHNSYDVKLYHLLVLTLITCVLPLLLDTLLLYFSKSERTYHITHIFAGAFGSLLGHLVEMKYMYSNVRNSDWN